MDTDALSNCICPVARGVARVGDVWSMLILRNASLGQKRFDEFRQDLGIAPNILSRRLKALTEDGLLEKRRYSARPPRDEYVLTEAGRDFLPILQAIAGWARTHHGGGALTRFVDAETGDDIEPVVIDAKNGARIGDRPIEVVKP